MNQLFNWKGRLFGYQEFLCHYKIPVTPKDFAVVFDAIPSGDVMLFKGCTFPPSITTPSLDPVDTPVGKMCFQLASCKNYKKVCTLFQTHCISVPYIHVTATWNKLVQDSRWEKKYGLFLIDIYWLTKLKKFLSRSFIAIILPSNF